MDREDTYIELLRQFSPMEHKRLLYGEWLAENEQEKVSREVAEMYHTFCDNYDRRVCTGISPRTGEPIPLTSHEMNLINRYALQMRKEAILEGECRGCTQEQVLHAIRNYHKR